MLMFVKFNFSKFRPGPKIPHPFYALHPIHPFHAPAMDFTVTTRSPTP